MHVAAISRNLAKACHCLNNNHKKLFRVQLDSSLHHIMMTEAKSRNESIGFSLENIQ
jgi:hypothetical protein